MLDRIPQIGPREVQMALTSTLLGSTVALAAICDVLRYRQWRSRGGELATAASGDSPLVGRTLVPAGSYAEIPAAYGVPPQVAAYGAIPEPPAAPRKSRRWASLTLPSRSLSPGTAAAKRQAGGAGIAPPHTGYLTPTAFQQLLAEERKVGGQIVLIQLEGNEAAAPAIFRNFVRDLLEPHDLAAPLDGSHYIMVLQGLYGSKARERVRGISEHLRTLLTQAGDAYRISSKWTFVEVHDQTLGCAVEQAKVSLRERPGRKRAKGETRSAVREAV